MKKLKVFVLSAIAAATTSFATASLAADQKVDLSKLPKEHREAFHAAEGRIDPNNPDFNNLPPSEVEITFTKPKDGEISTQETEYLVGGEGQTYLNKDSFFYYGTHATISTKGVINPGISVTGILYKQAPGVTKLTQTDSDSDYDDYTDGMVVVTTGENELARGTVGTKILAEGIHTITSVFGTSTKDTSETVIIQ